MRNLINVVLLYCCFYGLLDACGRSRRRCRGRRAPPPDRTKPTISCPHDIHEYADPFQVNTKVWWNETSVVANDNRDGAITPRRTGRKPGKLFSEGVTTMRYHARDKSGNFASCSFRITVEVIRCSRWGRVSDGWKICHVSYDMRLGSICRFGCYSGHKLVGGSRTKCLKSRQWNIPTQPYCQKLECDALSPTASQYDVVDIVCTEGNFYRSKCLYICKEGYSVLPGHNKVRVCNEDGSWIGDTPTCVDTEAPVYSTCPYVKVGYAERSKTTGRVFWTQPSATDNSGSVTVVQTSGPSSGTEMSVGEHSVKYVANDDANNTAICEFNVIVKQIKCHTIYTLPYTSVVCPGGRIFGSSCEFVCDNGTSLNGQANVQCDKSDSVIPRGTWTFNNNQPYCENQNTCPALRAPDNGALVCDTWLSGRYCQVLCEEGCVVVDDPDTFINEVLIQQNLLVCSDSGAWYLNGDIPNCQEVSERLRQLLRIDIDYLYYEGKCNESRNDIKDKFMTAFTTSMGITCQPPACSIANVQIVCGKDTGTTSRKKRAIDSGIGFEVIMELSNSLDPTDIVKTRQSIKKALKNAQDNGNLGLTVDDATTNPTGIAVSLPEVTCSVGSAFDKKTIQCVKCNAGYYHDTVNDVCSPCARGQYQDTAQQTTCTKCPQGKTTAHKLARSSSECVDACPAGTFSPTATPPCSACDLGWYSVDLGNTDCTECPGSQVTLKPGASSITQCQEFDITYTVLDDTEEISAATFTSEVHLQNTFIMAFWVKCTQCDNIVTIVGADGQPMLSIINTDQLRIQLFGNLYAGGEDLAGSMLWKQVTVRYSGAEIQVYLNEKKLLNESVHSPPTMPASLNITAGGTGFIGSLSQLNMWSDINAYSPSDTNTCFIASKGDVISWRQVSDVDGSFITTQSYCDAEDNCHDSPCMNSGSCTDSIGTQVLAVDENMTVLGQLILSGFPADNMELLQILKTTLKNGVGAISPLCAGFVSMATINAIATPSTVTMATRQRHLTSLASEIISLIEGYRVEHSEFPSSVLKTDLLTSSSYQARVCVQLAHTFTSSHPAVTHWLMAAEKHISRMETVPVCITNLLVSVLLKIPDTQTSLLAIDRLSDVVRRDPSQGLYLLPVYLYVLGKKSCPTLRLHTLHALPKLATHKFNVAPVLKTILNLSQSPKLKSLSITLLTELWTQQNRCFPHLLKVITESGKGCIAMATVVDEVTLARAQAIKEICKLRPEQHGAEMLASLSEMLNACTDVHSAPAAALCLEALYYICQAEVIDIMSAWRVLERLLSTDTRTVVMVKVCELLSLVPGLQVKSAEYEVFLHESVRRLWIYTKINEGKVSSAAYMALSSYNSEHFRISHFTYQIVKEYIIQAEAVLAKSENEEDTVDSVMPFVPGVCYMRLLSEMEHSTMKGFGDFLSAMVAQEVENLPRGIYFTSLRQHGAATNRGKEMASIPGFMQSQYESTRQPGLRPGLAVALLFCYDPVVEVGRDGRPRKHYVISHGKNYQQMFTALLQDVPVQPLEWYRTSMIGPAWMTYVDRLFASMLQARRVEIDLQLTRDFIDENEADDKKVSAWLWVRDTLVDSIKKSTRSNPSVQFNCILALSALASTTHRYMSSLDVQEKKQAGSITEHTSHSHWLMIVIDSCMSLVDFTYRPKSSLLGLCQQRSVDDRLPASILAQAAAVLALCQIAPLIIGNYVELVYKLINMLTGWLPRQRTDEDCPPVLYQLRGFSLGVMLEQLVQENFPEIAGSKGSLAVWKALDQLEEYCLSQHEHKTGALLGLSSCLGALCQDGKTESRVHVASVYAKLNDLVKVTSVDDSTFQPLCTCLALVTGCGFLANTMDKECTDNTLLILKTHQENNGKNVGLCRALGLLCYAADMGGHPTIGQFRQNLFANWIKSAANAECSELERVASLAGLAALLGCNESLRKNESRSATGCDVGVDRVVRCTRDLVTSSDLIGIRATASWLLGSLYLSVSSTSRSSSTAPGSYSYLQESSILRAVVDFLNHAGKQGPEFTPNEQVNICLKSLQDRVSGTLPPLNWLGLFSPLMKLPFDADVKLSCIQLAVKISSSSPSASLFLSAWIVPPLFNTLDMRCQCLLLSAAGSYVKAVTPATLQTFINKTCKPLFTGTAGSGHVLTRSAKGRALQLATLKGLNSALLITDPPASVTAILYRMMEFVYKQTETEIDVGVLASLSECLRHVPDALLDELTTADCVDEMSVIRGTYVRSFLVGNGHQPVALLNSCIDAAFNMECDRDRLLWYLMHCFHHMTTIDGGSKSTIDGGSKSPMMQRVQWLIEVAGHCRNIATRTFKLESQHVGISEITKFVVGIIAAAICLWTNKSSSAVLLGVNSDLMRAQPKCNESFDWINGCHVTDNPEADWLGSVKPLDCLPPCIENLTAEPWVQILPKIIDWHIAMMETSDDITLREVKIKLVESLSCLRHSLEYGKLAVWTKTVLCTV